MDQALKFMQAHTQPADLETLTGAGKSSGDTGWVDRHRRRCTRRQGAVERWHKTRAKVENLGKAMWLTTNVDGAQRLSSVNVGVMWVEFPGVVAAVVWVQFC